MRPISQAFVSLSAFVVCAAAHAGDLFPPVGPVAPSMKDLNAIMPRTVLKSFFVAGGAVNTITVPGQYIATGDIVVPAGKHGVLVNLPPGTSGVVSIDLNGFSIVGQPGSFDGVRKDGAFTAADFNIFNGRIVGMGGDGVHIENLGGADVSVTILNCAGDGIEFLGVPEATAVAINSKAPPPGAGNIVKGMGGHAVRASGCGNVIIDYTVADCALDGIFVENADRCDLSFDVSRCAGNGVTVTGCPEVFGMAINAKALPGGGVGIRHRVAQCGNGVVVSQCGSVEFTGLRVSGSGGGGGGGGLPGVGRGIVFQSCGRVSLTDCHISECDSHGAVVADAVKFIYKGMDATGNAGDGLNIVGVDTVLISDGVISSCGGDGVHIEGAAGASDKFAQIRGFSVERCAGDGMEIECDDLDIADCVTQNNGGNGIHARDIRKNLTINLVRSTNNQDNGLLVPAAVTGVRAQGKQTQVTRSNISNNRLAGISLEIAGTLTMAEVDASGNDLAGCDALLLPALGSVQEKAKQVKCRFVGNGFGTPDALPGCMIRGAESVELREVDCSGNAGSGLVVADLSRDGRLDLVTCSSNGEYGVRFTSFLGLSGGRVRARDLHCDGNAFDGLLFESTTGGEVADSTFSNNGAIGVRVLSFNHLVQRCTFSANTGGPVFALLPGNTVAPIVDEGTTPTNCNPSANHIR